MKYAFERIEAYKQLLAKEAIDFYCNIVSDETIIFDESQPTTWKVLKIKVMGVENFKD